MSVVQRPMLSDKILNCILIQTKPGMESEVQKEIERKIGDKALVFLGLGRYDLIVLSEQQNFSVFEAFRQVRLDGIVDWCSVCGGRWILPNCEPLPFFSNKAKEIGVCLIKPSKPSSGASPIEQEEALVLEILKHEGILVYSNLSNYELVCLIQVNNLPEFDAKVKSLKNRLISGEKLLVLDFVTIPAVNQAHLSSLEEETHILIFLSLRLGIATGFRKFLDEVLRIQGCNLLRIMPAYGFHDVVIEIDGNLGIIIRTILTLRKNAEKYGLLSTFTIVQQTEHMFDYTVQNSIQEDKMTNNKEEEAKAQSSSQVEDELASHFDNLITVNEQDTFTADLFRSHKQLIVTMDNIRKKSEDYRKNRMKDLYQAWALKYDNIADCLRIALSQRYCAIIPGNLLASKSLGLEPHGGIQRAILASESLPLYIFKRLQEKWEGFCVFGYYHRFFRQEGAIFNIPGFLRIKPKKWGGGLSHEIGHEIFFRVPFKLSLDMAKFVDSLCFELAEVFKKSGRPFNQRKTYYDVVNLVVEIFADLVSFAVCYQCDWEKYRDDFWKDLATEFPIDYRNIVRTEVVYLSLGPGENLALKSQIDELAAGWIEKLDSIVKQTINVGLSDDDKKDSIFWIRALAKFGRIVAPYFQSNFWKVDISEQEANTIADQLNQGFTYMTNNPINIIWALTSSRHDLSLKGNLAAILSLYESYWRNRN